MASRPVFSDRDAVRKRSGRRDIYLGNEPGSGTPARAAIWFENGEASINQVALRDVIASVLRL